MTKRQLVWGTIVAVVSLVAGLLMGRGIRGDTSREGFMSTRIESLEADHDALSRRLATALQDVARWKGLAEDVQRPIGRGIPHACVDEEAQMPLTFVIASAII